ncbi:MAG: RdgB/HAM1 family non-canonical purine NTP pyrophosphatase [Gemmatimonadaceae bacterium]
MQEVLLATRSEGKLRELRALLLTEGVRVLDLTAAGIPESAAEDDLECFETFEENALAKARYFRSRAGLPVIADDSGLSVDALGGQPGVRSKRWSGRGDLRGPALDDANNAKLLATLAPFADRRAGYVCVAAYSDDAGELVGRGEARGEILPAPRGSGGFGYDPYFQSAELGRTFAEATMEEKGAVSHRGRAFAALLTALAARR